jgi:MFS family permease
MAYSASLVLFPHYQALARSDRLRLTMTSLVTWVIVQNIGTGFFSVLTGPVADRRGNRVVMQWVMLIIAAMPPAAIALSYAGDWGRWLYPAIFFFLGMTPVGLKTLNNYTLEISPTSEHPKYLATIGLCMAAPLILSPLLGLLVEVTSFEVVFFGISAVIFLGWLLTLRLAEPREALIDEVLDVEP